jgi:hypothetical protein
MPGCEKRPMLQKPLVPPRECMEAARWMLLEAAQRDLPLWKIEFLMSEKRTVHRVHPAGVWQPQQEAHEGGLRPGELACAPGTHPLSKLYLLDNHVKDHGRMDSMVMQPKASRWPSKSEATASPASTCPRDVESRC